MTIARKHIVCLDTTPYYHVIGRCVRRAFLCGLDMHSGKDYEHRRRWVVERLALLARVFAIDICAYSIMSNHYHLVVRLAPARGLGWSDEEVVARWALVYGMPAAIQMGVKPDASEAQKARAAELIQIRRERLADLSWFMKCLNEHIARRANAEDRCTGSFWEGRYKSQALLDERALVTCMSYADLNPIRAGIAHSLGESDYTSIQQRIEALQGDTSPIPLARFRDEPLNSKWALPFYLRDYLELVDWSGRIVLPQKRGAIPSDLPKILDRISFDQATLLQGYRLFGGKMMPVVGPADAIRRAARGQRRRWFRGASQCEAIFGPH